MARNVSKTSEQLLSALEDHLFLLTQSLHGLHSGDAAFIRELSCKLRALVCYSKGVDGLLWRVCDEIGADDTVLLRYPGTANLQNPLVKALDCIHVPVAWDGSGDERIPLKPWRLRDHVKTHQILFIQGESVTPERLISMLANEAGIAHEADHVSKMLAKINAARQGDVPPYFSILDSIARLALQVGERVIDVAVGAGYKRRRSPSAPPQSDINLQRFSNAHEIPSLPYGDRRQGSVLLDINLSGPIGRSAPRKLPPVTQSGVTVSMEITRRGRLAIQVNGLPLPMFRCECAVPQDGERPLSICVTWRGMDVRVYVGREQVSGIRSAPTASD